MPTPASLHRRDRADTLVGPYVYSRGMREPVELHGRERICPLKGIRQHRQ